MSNDIRGSLYVMILPYKDESEVIKNNTLETNDMGNTVHTEKKRRM